MNNFNLESEINEDLSLDLDLEFESGKSESEENMVKITIDKFKESADKYFGEVSNIKGIVISKSKAKTSTYILLVFTSKKRRDRPSKVMQVWYYSDKTKTSSPTNKSIKFDIEYADTISDFLLED